MQCCHEWTFEEDKYCCRIYIWYMFTKLPKTKDQEENLIMFAEYQEMLSVESLRELITFVRKKYYYTSEKEVLSQIRKIKQISVELLGEDSVPIIPMLNYRKQLKDAFCITMDEIDGLLRHEPPPKTREELLEEMQEYIEKYGKFIISEDPDDFF